MTDWMPQSTKGNVSQYLAPALVFAAAVVVFVALAVSYS